MPPPRPSRLPQVRITSLRLAHFVSSEVCSCSRGGSKPRTDITVQGPVFLFLLAVNKPERNRYRHRQVGKEGGTSARRAEPKLVRLFVSVCSDWTEPVFAWHTEGKLVDSVLQSLSALAVFTEPELVGTGLVSGSGSCCKPELFGFYYFNVL